MEDSPENKSVFVYIKQSALIRVIFADSSSK